MSVLGFIESRGAAAAKLTSAEVLELWAAGVLPDDEPFELIDGEIVPMAAAKLNPHEHVKALLNRWFVKRLSDDFILSPEPWFQLDEHNACEPDLLIYPESLLPLELTGPTVSLLIEVADTSLLYDRREKARRYSHYGVRDYWVIDTTRKQTWVHRQPSPEGYREIFAVRRGGPLTPLQFPALTLRLDDLAWRTFFHADD